MKRYYYLASFIFCVTYGFEVSACLNTYVTLRNGNNMYDWDEDLGVHYWKHELDTHELSQDALTYWERYERSDSLEYLSDYAATIIYLGKYDEAVKWLNLIERQRPGMYNTASNLGTAYELAGNVDSAYYWINRSIELNPGSHEGSEWIHLKILEYKRSGKKEVTTSVLGLDFGSGQIPENTHGYDLIALYLDITYQLKERTLFIKPQDHDPIVGSIYFDLGNIIGQQLEWHNYRWNARESYRDAFDYGFTIPLVTTREKYFDELVRRMAVEGPKPPVLKIVLISLSALVAIVLAIWFFRRRRKQV